MRRYPSCLAAEGSKMANLVLSIQIPWNVNWWSKSQDATATAAAIRIQASRELSAGVVLSRQEEMQIGCPDTFKSIRYKSCQSKVPKAKGYKRSKPHCICLRLCPASEAWGWKQRRGDWKQGNKRWGEKRRSGKKQERLKGLKKEPTQREDFREW